MQESTEDYPNLASLLSAWFHQDFDIEGETIEDIVNAYVRASPDRERQLLAEEITRFLETHKDSLDSEFLRILEPEVEVTGFAASTQAFLQEVYLQIKKSTNNNESVKA